MSQYLHVGVILITVPNLIVIGLMILLFAAAVFVSLPQETANETSAEASAQATIQAPTEQQSAEN